jgi:lysophospholipase L1-like esterase
MPCRYATAHAIFHGTAKVVLILAAGAGFTDARADMMSDSPVTFPERGALPAKHRPDRPSRDREKPEEGYYLFTTPERSLKQIATIQKEMPKGTFTPPSQDWAHLRRTRRILTEGGDLSVLAMGDSIVNDTMRSAWVARLSESYPRADIRAWVYVRGGGACRHYKDENRVARHVVPRKPDLVLIGGISQGGEIENIRTVIGQLRAALPDVEILLTTGVFGSQADPRDPEELAKAPYSGAGDYGAKLKELAEQERCAYLDMTTPWAEYVRSAGVHPHRFYRDRVHANEYGEQILSKILMSFFRH